MENFLPDLPARCAAVAAGKKKKKKRGRKETTGKCGRVRGGECGSELVVPLLVAVVVVVVVVLCVCVCVYVFYFGSLVVTIFYSEYLFSRWYWCLIWRFGARREASSLTMAMSIGF
jgi:hypothetical protein